MGVLAPTGAMVSANTFGATVSANRAGATVSAYLGDTLAGFFVSGAFATGAGEGLLSASGFFGPEK